ncbi:MAG: DNA-binding protein WhiA [Clostridiales bacterium]|nr:DNA-binding protein WhiA [Clostridiales bacterium]
MESFSYRVKSEILDSINSRQNADACLLGILYTCKVFSQREILFVTENENTVNFFVKSINKICDTDNSVVIKVNKKVKASVYILNVKKEYISVVFNYYKLSYDFFENNYEKAVLPKKRFISSLVAGAFLSCGSINDPNKEYHFELVFRDVQMCNFFGIVLIDNYGIVPKHTERKNYEVVYIKESENIEDMLTLMGAQNCSLEIMNIKIFKDIRNKINRAVNCDNANIEKAIKAAERQINDIELIEKIKGLSSLTDDLREIAEIRLENPDINLKELGQAVNPPISRSGANHRFNRIAKIADQLRKDIS